MRRVRDKRKTIITLCAISSLWSRLSAAAILISLLNASPAGAALIARLDFENNLTNSVNSLYDAVYKGSNSKIYSSDAKSGEQSLLFSNSEWGSVPADKINILNGGNWGGTSSWTFSAWVKPSVSSGTVFSARSIDSKYGLYCDFRGDKISIYWDSDIPGTGDKKSTSATWGRGLNVWSMLTVAFDASSKKIRIYRYTDPSEGLVLLKEAAYGIPLTLTDFQLGYNGGTASGFGGFSGNIDNVCIYDRALSASEIIDITPDKPEFNTGESKQLEIKAKFSDLGSPVYVDIFPENVPFAQPIYTPRGNTVFFRLDIQGLVSDKIVFSPGGFVRYGDNGNISLNVTVNKLIPVHIEGNTQGSKCNYPGGAVPENWLPYLVRKAPFNLFEAVDETVCTEVNLDAGEHAGFIVSVKIPSDADPGLYQSELRLEEVDSKHVSLLPFMIQIGSTILPDQFEISSTHWLWPEPENLTSGKVPEYWSEEHWTLLKNSGKSLFACGDNTVYTPLIFGSVPLIQTVKVNDNTYEFDFSGLERWISTFRQIGFDYFTGHHLINRLLPLYIKDAQSGQTLRIKLLTPEYRNVITAFLPQLYRELQKLGLEDRYFQYQKDEPQPKEYDDYVIYAGIKQKELPGIKSIDAITGKYSEQYFDLTDIHVVNLYGASCLGEKVISHPGKYWLYCCTSPYPPLPNRHLDSFPVENRLWPMITVDLGMNGFLNWAANVYRGADEYKTSLGPLPNGTQSPGHPPGDAWFFYRGPKGLRPGVRMLNYRDGMVDATLFKLLQQKDPEAAHQIVSRVIYKELLQSFELGFPQKIAAAKAGRGYSVDPGQYNELRGRLLEKLDNP